MYTPKAFFEERGESAKYLDLSGITKQQRKDINALTLRPGWIMIVDSGTAGKLMGRVGLTTAVHDGAVGNNNNMIRVIIDDPTLRYYVYQFLRSPIGQALLLRNVYGTNQDHIEPDDVKDIPIPIPKQMDRVGAITDRVQECISLRERAAAIDGEATDALNSFLYSSFTEIGVEMPKLQGADEAPE